MSKHKQPSGKEPEKHNPHDAAFKSAFQKTEVARSFFRNHLPVEIGKHIDFGKLELVNKSYVDENMKELHSDIVYLTRMKGRKGFLYLLFEHQSKPDYRMVFRLLCYMINLWKGWWDQHPKAKHLPAIIPMVFYHGKRSWKSPLRFRKLFAEGEAFTAFIPDFTYRLFDLGAYEDEAIAQIMPALSAVLYVFRHIFDEDFETNIVRKLAEILSKIEDHMEFAEFWNWALRYACEARRENKEELVAAITEATGNINDERVKMAAMTIADQFRLEGRQEGKERVSLILLKLLKKRFANVSPVIEQKLKLSDFDMLDRFGESIFEFKDLSDVEKWWELHDRKTRVRV